MKTLLPLLIGFVQGIVMMTLIKTCTFNWVNVLSNVIGFALACLIILIIEVVK